MAAGLAPLSLNGYPALGFVDGNGEFQPISLLNGLPVVMATGQTGTGSQQVQGTAADGAPAVGNPVQIAGVDGSGNTQALRLDVQGRLGMAGGVGTLNSDAQTAQIGLFLGDTTSERALAVGMNALGPATYERWRNNQAGTALASSARTGSTNSPDIINYNHRTVTAYLNITAVPGGDTVKVGIYAKDPVSGAYYLLLESATTAVTGLTVIRLGPGLENENNVRKADALPRTFRFGTTHSGSGSFTYSIGYDLGI